MRLAANLGILAHPFAVIPLTTSGLHCGWDLEERPEPVELVIPLTTSGLHCGGLIHCVVAWREDVIPLTTSGLHCGYRRAGAGVCAAEVIPLTTSGFHLRQLIRALGASQSDGSLGPHVAPGAGEPRHG